MKFKHSNGADGKFFTNAASLKKTLDQIPKDAFPFSTTIKGMKCGMVRSINSLSKHENTFQQQGD